MPFSESSIKLVPLIVFGIDNLNNAKAIKYKEFKANGLVGIEHEQRTLFK